MRVMKLSNQAGRPVALLLAVSLLLIVAAVALPVGAQSQDPLELYDDNDNGVIDADELISAAVDYLAGRIDRDLVLSVLDLYLAAAAPVSGQSEQSWPDACGRYDGNDNDNGMIERDEVIAAIRDFLFNSTLTREKAIEVIECYLFGPLLNFPVSAKVHGGNEDNKPLHDAKWTIANNYLTLKLEDAPIGVDLAHYDYQVRASSGTGVQAGRRSDCLRPSWAPTNSDWFNATTTPTDNYSGVFLLRCGFGDGTTNLEIWLRHRAAGQVFSSASYSGVMRQPWHDQDRYITYQIGCMPASTVDLNYVDGIVAGADAWNDADVRITLTRYLGVTDCTNLHESGRVTVTLGTDCTGHALACAPNNSSPSDYPHLTDRKIIINDPPAPSFTWSSDANGDNMIEPNQYYLPATMMHEFGHSAGLFHSANSSDLMATALRNGVIIRNPTSNDIAAMRDMNRTHTH